MATRRDAREWALQVLFGLDLNPRNDVDEVLADFMSDKNSDQRTRAFVQELVEGVCRERSSLDKVLQRHAEHWDMKRMGVVDRNILRAALFELLHMKDAPPPVVINEAVDVAKYFSTDASGRFVNGILDKARKDLPDGSK